MILCFSSTSPLWSMSRLLSLTQWRSTRCSCVFASPCLRRTYDLFFATDESDWTDPVRLIGAAMRLEVGLTNNKDRKLSLKTNQLMTPHNYLWKRISFPLSEQVEWSFGIVKSCFFFESSMFHMFLLEKNVSFSKKFFYIIKIKQSFIQLTIQKRQFSCSVDPRRHLSEPWVKPSVNKWRFKDSIDSMLGDADTRLSAITLLLTGSISLHISKFGTTALNLI